MAGAFAAIAITTAFRLLAVLHGASAARPMGWQAAASSGTATSSLALALAPTYGHQNHQRRAAAVAAARAGKWLPFAGVHHHLPAAAARAGKWLPFAGVHHHLPVAAAYWAHRPVPWVGAGDLGGGAAGAVEGVDGEGEEVVRDRERRQQRRSYEGDDGSTTRQEQLAMWASLLNPKGKGRAAGTGWLPAPGAGEVADDDTAKAADAVEGAEVDDTAADGARVGQTYWGNNGN